MDHGAWHSPKRCILLTRLLHALALIHPSALKGCSQTFVFLQLSEVVKILIPFTSNSHLHPLQCAKKPTKWKEVN
jgi:hypothetical protein